MTFDLALATRCVDRLEEFDAIAPFPQPLDALGRDVGVHDHTVTGLAGPDNDYPELVPEVG
jgi:hypothetical protein